MRKFNVSILLFLTCVMAAGLIVGRYYPTVLTGIAQARPDIPDQPKPPEWSELNVVYVGSDSMSKAVSAQTLAALNSQAFLGIEQVKEYGRTKGIDVLLVENLALAKLDTGWLKQQFRHGTAIVGINITGPALGILTGDSDFNTNKNWNSVTWPGEYLSYTAYRVSGNPKEISLLEERGALFPENLAVQNELGIKTVAISYIRSYGPMDGTLQESLEDLRLFLAGRERVKPFQPTE